MAHSDRVNSRPTSASADSDDPVRPAWPDEFRSVLEGSYRGRRVLVAGADGFLGYNCALALRELGAIVSAITRRRESRAATIAQHVHRLDLQSADGAAAAVRDQEFVFDFAGTSGAVNSNISPSAYVAAETNPQLALLEACAKYSPDAVVVFPSSRLVYGRPAYLPVDECHPLAPQSMYAASKIATENYIRAFAEFAGLRSVILRLSNPYGPNMLIDRVHHNVINRFMYQAARGQAIRIYGEGEQRRDYFHVFDAINAILGAAASSACYGGTFNVGGTIPIEIRQAVAIIASEVRNAIIEHVPWPAAAEAIETGDYYCSMDRLRERIALPPPIPIKEGLRTTTRHYLVTCRDSKVAYVS